MTDAPQQAGYGYLTRPDVAPFIPRGAVSALDVGCSEGGFGESLGNDVSLLRSTIGPAAAVLAAARAAGLTVVHTREGHRPDLTDCPPAKLERGGAAVIGTDGPMGRILVRGAAVLVDGEAGRERYRAISELQVRRYQPDKDAVAAAERMAARGAPVVIEIEPRSIVSWGR